MHAVIANSQGCGYTVAIHYNRHCSVSTHRMSFHDTLQLSQQLFTGDSVHLLNSREDTRPGQGEATSVER